jgi:uncharacterized protein (TIGR02266 family)
MTQQPHSAVWRVPAQGVCRLEGESGIAAGVLCNLSLGGAFVALDSVPRVGENVVLSFALPGDASALAMDAVVCWDNSERRATGLPPGCGLEFLAPAWADRQRIEAAVRASIGDQPGPSFPGCSS